MPSGIAQPRTGQGDTGVVSRDPRGTTEATTDRTGPTRRSGMPKILVVDDDEDTRETIVTMLERDGFDVLEALDGEDAVTLAQRECPDLVILDVMMPGMSGYSVCRRLRDDGLLCETPVLMVTALSMLDDQLEGITCGADGFMVKPVSRFELMTRVWDLL
ncbi:MAG: response regulator [Actinomycetales bacterium]|nr:response regulator [Actinomycetales bacterium]